MNIDVEMRAFDTKVYVFRYTNGRDWKDIKYLFDPEDHDLMKNESCGWMLVENFVEEG